MSAIPDFSAGELQVVREALRERYGSNAVEPDVAETELRLDPNDHELTVCPALYWEVRGCHFVICKTGVERYRCQFFYSIREQYSTGVEEYTDLGDCVLTLLRIQADQESRRNPAASNS